MLARFFYKCRHVFAVLAAVFAAALVWLWPQQPLWRSPANVGRLESFSPDGSVIVTSLTPPPDVNGNPDPVVYRWNAQLGELVSRVELPCTERKAIKRVLPSADGRLALVGEGASSSPARGDFHSGDWFLHDAITGRRLSGPIPKLTEARLETVFYPTLFSPDGQWFHGRRIRTDKGIKMCAEVFSATTGDLVLSCAPDGYGCIVWSIAPDGSSAAISLAAINGRIKGIPDAVMIVELPSGKELRRFDLPFDSIIGINHWDGRRLHTTLRSPNGPNGIKVLSSLTFDTTLEPIGEGVGDPMLVAEFPNDGQPKYWLDGSESVAYVQILSGLDIVQTRPWYQEARQWLAKHVGVSYTPPRGVHVSVNVVNRQSKATTFVSPQPLGHPVMVSPSGRLLACATDDNGIAVWDTNPGPRWAWSLAAGFGALAVFWLLGRVRWRRSPTPPLLVPYSPAPN